MRYSGTQPDIHFNAKTASLRYDCCAFHINLSVSPMSRPRASSLRLVREESNDSPCNWRLRSNLTAANIGFFLASRCALNFPATLSSMFFFFTQVRSGPVHSWPVERLISVSFSHYPLCGSLRWRSISHYFDTMLHIKNTNAMFDQISDSVV